MEFALRRDDKAAGVYVVSWSSTTVVSYQEVGEELRGVLRTTRPLPFLDSINSTALSSVIYTKPFPSPSYKVNFAPTQIYDKLDNDKNKW